MWSNRVTCPRHGPAGACLEPQVVDQVLRQDRDGRGSKLVVFCVDTPTRRSIAENIRVEAGAALSQIRKGEAKVKNVTLGCDVCNLGGRFGFVRSNSEPSWCE